MSSSFTQKHEQKRVWIGLKRCVAFFLFCNQFHLQGIMNRTVYKIAVLKEGRFLLGVVFHRDTVNRLDIRSAVGLCEQARVITSRFTSQKIIFTYANNNEQHS